MSTDREVLRHLADLAAAVERDRKVLATIESRIDMIHDEQRRSAETLTRLKLMADNAKKVALSQGETMNLILSRLDYEAK